jgi:hypothetical protein
VRPEQQVPEGKHVTPWARHDEPLVHVAVYGSHVRPLQHAVELHDCPLDAHDGGVWQ